MSKFIYLFSLACLLILTSSLRTKKTRCMGEGDNCDLTAYCCSNLVCKDYRCAVKGTPENQEEWTPYGKNVIGSIIVQKIINVKVIDV